MEDKKISGGRVTLNSGDIKVGDFVTPATTGIVAKVVSISQEGIAELQTFDGKKLYYYLELLQVLK